MAEQGTAPPTTNVQAPAVGLAGVTVSFRLAERATFTAVEGASLAVADGEVVALVGPTGCGQSTLLNVAGRPLAPPAPSRPGVRRAARRAQRPGRLPVSGRCAVSLEDGAGQRSDRARGRRRRDGCGARAGARLARAGGPCRIRGALSAHAVGRPAQARRARPGADPR